MMDRRQFIGILAGAFTLNLLPSGFQGKAVPKRLPSFDRSLVKFTPFMPMMEQAVIVSKAIAPVSHTCACGFEAHGMWASAVVRERVMSRREMEAEKTEAKINALRMLEMLWRETVESGLVRHTGCPLQPTLKGA